ncbi:MAG: polysaccharide biosynthesis C-terminal domain-containing protein [Candidatus Baltobacteraceae bacterium]
MKRTPGDFSKKTLETFLLRLLTQMLSVAGGIAVARALGPSGKGVFAYATTVLALLVSVSGGASAAVSRQYGRLKVPGGVVYAGMVRLFLIACLPLSAGLAAFALATHQTILLAPAFAFPFAYINQVTLAFSLADGEVRWANVQGLAIAMALAVATVVLCVLLHRDINALLVALVVIYAAVSVYSFVKIRRYAVRSGDAPQRRQVLREQAVFGARVTVNQLLASLNFQIDIFIVLALLGHAKLGTYSVAVGLGQMMWFLSRPLAVTSYGQVTSGTRAQAVQITLLCVRHALLAVGLACIVLFFLGPRIIVFVYGPAFYDSGPALQWLLPGILAYCVVPFFAQYFTLQAGKPAINTAVTVLSIVICAALTFVLAPRFGIIGGSIGTSASYVLSLAVAIAIFQKETGTGLREIFTFDRADVGRYSALVRWAAGSLFRLARTGRPAAPSQQPNEKLS